MNKNKSAAVVTMICAGTIFLAGCSPKSATEPNSAGESAPNKTATGATTGSDTTSNSNGTKNSESAQSPDKSKGAEKTISAEQELPIIASAQKKIDLSTMHDPSVICTVDKAPITIGDYRRQFKMQEEQVRMRLSVDNSTMEQLLAVAKENHVALTSDERKRLLDTAKTAIKASGKVFTKYLADNHVTEEQFNQRVLDTGLAVKAASDVINKTLLGELVDRELLCTAARESGMGPAAMTKYAELKKSPQYKQIASTGLLSEDQIKDESIKSDLMQHMIQKLQEKSAASDKQIAEIYEKNRSKLKHGERVRLSQIFIAAPKIDSPAGESIKSQLKKQNPKLSETQLDAEAKATDLQIRKKAEEVLTKALKGADFAKLANDYTDDIPAKAAKLGGDMGYQETDKLTKDFAAHIAALKPGEIFSELIPSPLGYHIIKVTDKQQSGSLPLAEVKDMLSQAITQSNATQAVSKWLYDHRKTAQITLSPEFQQLVSLPQKTIKPSAD